MRKGFAYSLFGIILLFFYLLFFWRAHYYHIETYETKKKEEISLEFGEKIESDIRIKGKVKSITFFINNKGDEKGQVKLNVQQGKDFWTHKIAVLPGNRRYEVPLKVKGGDFKVTIQNESIHKGRVFINTTNDNCLGTILQIGVVYILEEWKWFTIILGAFASLMLIRIIVLCCKIDAENWYKQIYCITLALIWILNIIKFPYFFWGGAYYETWGLYILPAIEPGLKNITLGDAGYWPFLNRILIELISIIVSKKELIILFSYWVGILIFSLICVKIILCEYRKFFCIQVRVFIALLLGMSSVLVRSEQMISLLNYPYIGLVYLLLNLHMELENKSRLVIFWLCATSILFVSKGTYLALIPGLLFLFGYEIITHKIKKSIYILSVLCALGVQTVYIVVNSIGEIETGEVVKKGIQAIYSFLIISVRFFVGNNVEISKFLGGGIAGVFLGINIVLVYKIWTRKKENALIYLVLWSMAFGSVLIDSLSKGICTKGIEEQGEIFPLFNFDWYNKNAFFIMLFCLYTLLVVCSEIKTLAKGIFVYLGVIGLFLPVYIEEKVETIEGAYKYADFATEENWAVPINVDGCFAKKGDIEIQYWGNGQKIWKGEKNNYYFGPDKIQSGNEIPISEICFEKKEMVTSVFIGKASAGEVDEIVCVLIDENKNPMYRCKGEKSVLENSGMAFNMNEFREEVSGIVFEDFQGNRISAAAQVYVVVRQ